MSEKCFLMVSHRCFFDIEYKIWTYIYGSISIDRDAHFFIIIISVSSSFNERLQGFQFTQKVNKFIMRLIISGKVQVCLSRAICPLPPLKFVLNRLLINRLIIYKC